MCRIMGFQHTSGTLLASYNVKSQGGKENGTNSRTINGMGERGTNLTLT